MDRHVQNAQAVEEFLSQHPKVAWLSSARLAGKTFIESLHLFSHLANVGDARSLVIHPASTTHQQLSDAELEAAGVDAGMIRLSIGLETKEDLLWDLDQ